MGSLTILTLAVSVYEAEVYAKFANEAGADICLLSIHFEVEGDPNTLLKAVRGCGTDIDTITRESFLLCAEVTSDCELVGQRIKELCKLKTISVCKEEY